MVSSFEQNLILKQAFHSILIRQLCQSTGYYEIEFSSIVRRNLSSALTQEVQYLVVVVINIIC
jgi:hypothetical protein